MSLGVEMPGMAILARAIYVAASFSTAATFSVTRSLADTTPPNWLLGHSVVAQQVRQLTIEDLDKDEKRDEVWKLRMSLYISTAGRIFSRYSRELSTGGIVYNTDAYDYLGEDPSRGGEPVTMTYTTFQSFRFEGDKISAVQRNGKHARNWEVQINAKDWTCSVRVIETSNGTPDATAFESRSSSPHPKADYVTSEGPKRMLKMSESGRDCRIMEGNVFE